MAELAVVSSRRPRLQALVERNVKGSRRALALASHPGKFLSTVQIGITLVGVLSGAFSGATLGSRLAQWLREFGLTAGLSDAIGVGIVVSVITYASLIVGELVPKQIALANPERVAVRVAPAMKILASIASPLVWLLDASGRAVLRLLRQSPGSERRVTDEEIRALISEAAATGVIEPDERAMMSGVMRFADRPVRAIMTARHEVDMLNLAAEPEQQRMLIVNSVHSRFPAYEAGPDHVIGVVQAKDVVDSFLRGDDVDLRRFVREAPGIPDTAAALDVVDAIKDSPVHMALVHDEYGQFEGVVTNADILEAIVGAFRTDEGAPVPGAAQRDDGSWLLAGSMPADEMAEQLGLPLPERRAYHTAAGFAIDQLGDLPREGESFEVSGWRFEIIDLDGRRIDKLLARRVPPRRAAAVSR
jgi:putative hemolysin